MEVGVQQPLDGGGEINQALSGSLVQDAKRAHETDLALLRLASPLAFVDEKERVGRMSQAIVIASRSPAPSLSNSSSFKGESTFS